MWGTIRVFSPQDVGPSAQSQVPFAVKAFCEKSQQRATEPNAQRRGNERVLCETSQAFRYLAPAAGRMHGPCLSRPPVTRHRSPPYLLGTVSRKSASLPWTRKREALSELFHPNHARRAVTKLPVRRFEKAAGVWKETRRRLPPRETVCRLLTETRSCDSSSTYIVPPRHLSRLHTLVDSQLSHPRVQPCLVELWGWVSRPLVPPDAF